MLDSNIGSKCTLKKKPFSCSDKKKLIMLLTKKLKQELEIMGDPMRKEVGMVRKKIDMANRDIKSLAQSCQKKVSSHIFILYNKQLCSKTLCFNRRE